jgi:winged helix-turn-helix DNA-binding protein
MSRMKQVIDALEAERAEVVERLEWLEGQIKEFRRRDGAEAAGPEAPRRSTRRATARRASARRATARARRGDVKQQILDYLADHPGSTAGDVAKGIDANRNTVATRLSQLAKSGTIAKVERGYEFKQ